jgi:hypothetical protein
MARHLSHRACLPLSHLSTASTPTRPARRAPFSYPVFFSVFVPSLVQYPLARQTSAVTARFFTTSSPYAKTPLIVDTPVKHRGQAG